MENERIEDVEFEEINTRTIQGWLLKHRNASMWRLAWSVYWRIMLISAATVLITNLITRGQS